MSFRCSHWPLRGREAGISIETQVGAINLTAAILVLFPVNLKQMRVILAIIRRGEETTEHYADRVPSSAAKCHRFKDSRKHHDSHNHHLFSHFYIGLIQSKWSTDTLQSVRRWQEGLSESQMAARSKTFICWTAWTVDTSPFFFLTLIFSFQLKSRRYVFPCKIFEGLPGGDKEGGSCHFTHLLTNQVEHLQRTWSYKYSKTNPSFMFKRIEYLERTWSYKHFRQIQVPMFKSVEHLLFSDLSKHINICSLGNDHRRWRKSILKRLHLKHKILKEIEVLMFKKMI